MPSRTTRKAAQSGPQTIPTPPPANDKYAPQAWLAGGIGDVHDLEVPSGQMCLVRVPGIEGLMKAGVLRDLDSLTALVSEKHLKAGKGKDAKPEIDPKSLMGDDKAVGNILHTVDRVICHCVIKPEVQMTPNDPTRRQHGIVYADMIDVVDKMFIFNHVVGGTRDLESFRNELAGLVGGVEDVPGLREGSE